MPEVSKAKKRRQKRGEKLSKKTAKAKSLTKTPKRSTKKPKSPTKTFKRPTEDLNVSVLTDDEMGSPAKQLEESLKCKVRTGRRGLKKHPGDPSPKRRRKITSALSANAIKLLEATEARETAATETGFLNDAPLVGSELPHQVIKKTAIATSLVKQNLLGYKNLVHDHPQPNYRFGAKTAQMLERKRQRVRVRATDAQSVAGVLSQREIAAYEVNMAGIRVDEVIALAVGVASQETAPVLGIVLQHDMVNKQVKVEWLQPRGRGGFAGKFVRKPGSAEFWLSKDRIVYANSMTLDDQGRVPTLFRTVLKTIYDERK